MAMHGSMISMIDFIQQSLELTKSSTGPVWLEETREKARVVWQNQTLPTRKTEDWKYTSVRALSEHDLSQRQASLSEWEKHTSFTEVENLYRIEGLDSIKLVFVDSVYSESLSDSSFPEGVQLVRFQKANEIQKGMISTYLNSVLEVGERAKPHVFSSLNNSELADGVLLFVPRNFTLEQPVQVIHISTSKVTSQPRALVVLETNAQATLIEQFVSTDNNEQGFTNSITEVQLAENSRLNHYRINTEFENSLHIGGVHVNQSAHSNYNGFMLGLGGKLKRIDVVVNHNGEGSECQLNGVYLPKHKQQIDYHTNIEHRAPLGTTREIFRGIMADESKAVFNGRIHIHPDAQKTLAELNNRNLLLSDKAEINTKPELEIYADDVKCAHGATVSQINDEALYYMQSRGIAKEAAKMMLSFGFINELINAIELEPLQNLLRPLLTKQFSKHTSFLQNLEAIND